jgi:hypothetical protein
VALGGQAEGWRHGLGVLTGRGVAAWIQAWNIHRSPAPAPAVSEIGPLPAGRVLRGTATGEVVAVLASMALATSEAIPR